MVLFDVCVLFGLAKLSVALVCLVYAALKDLKFREVPNKVWALFFPVVLCLSLVEYLFFGFELLGFFLVMFAVAFLVFCAFYCFGVFGGADFKCGLCVAAGFPFAVFPMLVFTWLFVFMYMFFNFFRNLAVNSKGGFFGGGLETEGFLRKVYVLFIGKKTRVIEVYKKWWVIPVEYCGKFDFKVKSDSRKQYVVGREGKVWVSVGLPMVVFFSVALAFTLIIMPYFIL
jgi:Flp pilus assembly protein protease CpaA